MKVIQTWVFRRCTLPNNFSTLYNSAKKYFTYTGEWGRRHVGPLDTPLVWYLSPGEKNVNDPCSVHFRTFQFRILHPISHKIFAFLFSNFTPCRIRTFAFSHFTPENSKANFPSSGTEKGAHNSLFSVLCGRKIAFSDLDLRP